MGEGKRQRKHAPGQGELTKGSALLGRRHVAPTADGGDRAFGCRGAEDPEADGVATAAMFSALAAWRPLPTRPPFAAAADAVRLACQVVNALPALDVGTCQSGVPSITPRTALRSRTDAPIPVNASALPTNVR